MPAGFYVDIAMIQPKTIHITHPSGALYEAYNRFASSHPQKSFFQLPDFIGMTEKWPEAEWVLLLAVKEGGMKDPGVRQKKARTSEMIHEDRIAGSLLAVTIRENQQGPWKYWPLKPLHARLSARTLVYGGPLLAEGTRLQQETTLKSLLHALNLQVSDNSLFTQFRNSFDLTDKRILFRDYGYHWQDKLNLLVDTSSEDSAWKGLSATRRRQVNKSLKNGAQIVEHPTNAQIDEFYDILHELYTKKVRKPLPSREFFHAMHELSLKPGSSAPQPTTPPASSDAHGQPPPSSTHENQQLRDPYPNPSDIPPDAARENQQPTTNNLPASSDAHGQPPPSSAHENQQLRDPYTNPSDFPPDAARENQQPTTNNLPASSDAHGQPPPSSAHENQPTAKGRSPGATPATILLVTHENKVIGGIACPVTPGKAMYEWYVCGLDRQYKGKGIYPSVLVTWAAISRAAKNQIPCFDFMGMGNPEEPYGVRDFKARFGGNWVNHGRYARVNQKIMYSLAELGYNAWALLRRPPFPTHKSPPCTS